ncbi:MAG: glycosyltransferase 87 family protein [Gaiellaceae bacterium]
MGVCLLLFAGVVVVTVTALAVVHVDDRFDVGAASGAWIGLAAAAHAGVWYPVAYAHGFYGGTRYMPLPILVEVVGRAISGEYLVSAKVLVCLTNVALYALVFIVARRRGAPVPVAAAIVAAILTSSAATTTLLGIRWDALATLLQLAALAIVVAGASSRRSATAGGLCALAIGVKITALWAPAAIVVLLITKSRRPLGAFVGSFVAAVLFLFGVCELISRGRFLRQLVDFSFAGSGHSSIGEGLHRLYQLGLRNERSLPLLVAVAALGVVIRLARRRAEAYELAYLFAIPILVVVMRDFGAYENHLLDLEVLSGVVIAGYWRGAATRAPLTLGLAAVAASLVVAPIVAARYTLVPDARAALRHELRGRPDPRYSVHPLPTVVAEGTCALFEDATVPLLAGQRPIVLDAFILHRLQRDDPAAIRALVRRVAAERFEAVVLDVPLTDRGWFATLDFGSAVADALRAHYKPVSRASRDGFFVYEPASARRVPHRSCAIAPIDSWR